MGKVTLQDRVIPAPDVLSRNLEGETVLVNLASGQYFGLDPVGTRIWELLPGRDSLGDLVDGLLEEFEVDRTQAAADLLRLMEQLLDVGLVRLEPNP